VQKKVKQGIEVLNYILTKQ